MGDLRAYWRLALIAALTAFGAALVVFVLNLVVRSAPAPNRAIPALADNQVIFSTGDIERGSPYALDNLVATVRQAPRLAPAIEVRASRDQEWVLYGADDLNRWTASQGPVESKPAAELKRLGLATLKEFVAAGPWPRLLIMVHNREAAAARSLVETLGQRPEPELTLIYSPNHRLNRELRKVRPLWHVGADPVMRSQWQVLAAVWLEVLAPDDFDWLPQGFNARVENWHPRASREAERRRIPSLWRVDSVAELAAAPSGMPLMTYRPMRLLSSPAER